MPDQDLEAALTVSPLADGTWTAYADPNYEATYGMFGGWTAAVALRAVTSSFEGDATPCAFTINFVGKVDPGTEVNICTRRMGGSRSITHWQGEVISRDRRDVLAFVSVALAERQESDGHLGVVLPHAPDPDPLDYYRPAFPAGERLFIRPITGYPPFGRTDTSSTAWVQETSRRAVDHFQLAYLADARAPRSFFWSEGPRMSATVTLSIYFHATEQELDQVGDDYVLNEAFGTSGAQSISEEHLRIWSRQGVLLATSEQLAWYR
jgi:acyl-CoA thioesterase